jgi:hypothetical protein
MPLNENLKPLIEYYIIEKYKQELFLCLKKMSGKEIGVLPVGHNGKGDPDCVGITSCM